MDDEIKLKFCVFYFLKNNKGIGKPKKKKAQEKNK